MKQWGVTAEEMRQSESSNTALAASQVERLEGLAVALWESLGGSDGDDDADPATGLGEGERAELARRFQELRAQLESAQVGGN